MRKMVRYIVIVAFTLLLIFLIKIGIQSYMEDHDDHIGLTEVGPKINVLIMDIPNQTQKQLRQHIEDGTAFLLLWVEEKNGTKEMYTFNTMESLVRLEENKVGLLDMTDPVFKNLCIAQYDINEKKLLYTTMLSEKVLVIEPSRAYLIGEILSDSHNANRPAGEMVFSDGTRRELRIIKIPRSTISDATLQVSPNLNILNE